jgi:hypothetical protein
MRFLILVLLVLAALVILASVAIAIIRFLPVIALIALAFFAITLRHKRKLKRDIRKDVLNAPDRPHDEYHPSYTIKREKNCDTSEKH